MKKAIKFKYDCLDIIQVSKYSTSLLILDSQKNIIPITFQKKLSEY